MMVTAVAVAVAMAASALLPLVSRRPPQLLTLFFLLHVLLLSTVVVGTRLPPAFTGLPSFCQPARRQPPNGPVAILYPCCQQQQQQQQQPSSFLSPVVLLASAASSSSSSTTITTAKNDDKEDPRNSDNAYRIRFGGIGRLYASANNNIKQDSHTATSTTTTTTETVLERLRQATVVVVGVGGVGSWAAEAVARSGIGTVVLVDLDDVCASNTNRQLPALQSTVGQFKVHVLQRRLSDLGVPRVLAIPDFVSSDNVHALLDDIERQLQGNDTHHNNSTTPSSSITAVIDAIDGAADKAALLAALGGRVPIVVSCGAAAGLRDPQQVRVQDLTRIQNDKLLAATKKYLRRHYQFPSGLPFRELQKGRKVPKWYMDGVYSDELPSSIPQQQQPQQQSSLRQCDGALGTACFVTGTFGFLAASVVVDRIAQSSHASLTAIMHRRQKALSHSNNCKAERSVDKIQ